MPVQALILDQHAAHYHRRLSQRFPAVTFHAVNSPEGAKGVIADVAVIIALAHRVSRETIAAAKSLKWIQALTTGTDSLAPILPSQILLTSTRGVHGPQMSELAFLLMIALGRNLPRMLDNQAKATWGRWNQPILEDKTAVIVGVGILAEHLAERCKHFGMTVVGVSSGRTSAPHFDAVYPRSQLTTAAARADFLILMLPYSKETHHIINAEVLAAMKHSAFLINIARGGVVDEAVLIRHLEGGKIAGAGIDVFQTHPLPPESPFWRLRNVIITPNVGGHSDKFVEQTLTVVEPNMQSYLDGRLSDLRNLVPH
jgi:phosphoglycerate dehydrogenase-like enzyme